MNDAELETQAHYVRYLADRMELRDWKFDVAYEKSEQSLAIIEVFPQRSEAIVTLGGAFQESTVETQRYCLVHELLHAILQPMRDCVKTLEPMLAQSWPLLRVQHDNHVDTSGHKLACIIAPTLPSYDLWYAAQMAKRAASDRLPGLRNLRHKQKSR